MTDVVTDEPRSTVDTSAQVAAAPAKLARALSDRADKQTLIDQGILKNTNVAPALQAAQDALKRSQLEDALDQKLANRPAPEELVKNNILSADEVPPSK